MTGRVTADLEAAIPLRVFSSNGLANELSGVVDTGFNGYLTASPQTIALLKLPIAGHTEAQLGDGRCVRLPTYSVEIEWFGRRLEVPVLASGSGILVGMSLLRGYRLCVDVETDGDVDIVPRS